MLNTRLTSLLKKKMTRKEFIRYSALAFVSLFGAVGVITELLSHAATPYTSEEVERGTLTGDALVVSSTTTSDGKAVQFGTSSIAASGGVQALAADRVIDFFGVNTHMAYGATAYSNQALVTAVLADIGIRHIRDGWPIGWSGLVSWLKSVNEAHGITMSWLVDPVISKQSPATVISYIKSTGSDTYLDYIEGPNEWDSNNNSTGGGFTRNQASLGAVMQAIYAARASSGLAAIPILGPSFAHSFESPSTYQEVVGNLTTYIDYGNCHDYRGSQEADMSRQAAVIAAAQYVSKNEPLVTTESGWNDISANNVSGNPAITDNAIIATDIIRNHFMRFSSGSWRTDGPGSYVYELFEEASTASNGWGLCTDGGDAIGSSFTGSNVTSFYKPQATSLKAMISLLADKGVTFKPGKLEYTLTGTDTNIQTILLQKSDGSYWLCLWEVNRNLWDAATSAAVSPVPVRSNLTLTLSSNAATVSQYLPTSGGTTAIATASNVLSVAISCGPEVNLVKIVLE
jgi:hypothetical protein